MLPQPQNVKLRIARAGDRHWLWLLLLLVVLLRAPGLTRPLFMDEAPVLRNVAHFIRESTLLPVHFSYPPLFSYLAFPATGAGAVAGGLSTGLSPAHWAWIDGTLGARQLVLGARMLNLLLSVVAVWIIWAGTRGIPRYCRLAGAAVFLFSPEAVRYGALALPDIGAGVAAAASLLFADRYSTQLDPGRKPLRMLLLSGVCLGAAAAFKYNGGLAAPGVAIACFLSPGINRALRHLALVALVALATFLVLAPTWVVQFPRAWEGFLFETRNVRTERIGELGGTPLSMLMNLACSETGWLLALAAGFSVLLLGRLRRQLIIWSSPLFLNGLFVSTWGKQDANYLLPTMVMASVVLALAISTLPKRQLLSAGSTGIALLGLLFERPFPPWAEDQMAAKLARITGPDHLVLRFGPVTPKVWDTAEITALRTGSLAEKSPEARKVIERRLSSSPVAGDVVVWSEAPINLTPTRDTYVVATDRYLRRLQKAAALRKLPSEDPTSWLIRQLSDPAEWEVVARTRKGGEGWAFVLFRGKS